MADAVGTLGVKYPFSFAGGQVVMTSTHTELVGSRITFCLGTQVGERIMAPTWGIDIMGAAFELEGEISLRTVDNAVRWCMRRWFPDYEVRKVVADPTTDRNVLDVTITYGRYGSPLDDVAKVGVQVPGGSEIFPGESL